MSSVPTSPPNTIITSPSRPPPLGRSLDIRPRRAAAALLSSTSGLIALLSRHDGTAGTASGDVKNQRPPGAARRIVIETTSGDIEGDPELRTDSLRARPRRCSFRALRCGFTCTGRRPRSRPRSRGDEGGGGEHRVSLARHRTRSRALAGRPSRRRPRLRPRLPATVQVGHDLREQSDQAIRRASAGDLAVRIGGAQDLRDLEEGDRAGIAGEALPTVSWSSTPTCIRATSRTSTAGIGIAG